MSSDDYGYDIVCECGDDFPSEELLKVHLKLNNNHIFKETKQEINDYVITKQEIKEEVQTLEFLEVDETQAAILLDTVPEFQKTKIIKEEVTVTETILSNFSGCKESQEDTWKEENEARYFFEIDDTLCEEVVISEDPDYNVSVYEESTQYEITEEQNDPVLEDEICEDNVEVTEFILDNNDSEVFDNDAENKLNDEKKEINVNDLMLLSGQYVQRTDSEERPFVCKLCNKGFYKMANLKIHERIHTGDRSFLCDLCPKRFYNFYSLIRHKRIHTGEKPFGCPDCGKCFSQTGSLHGHLRAVHSKIPVPKPKSKERIRSEKGVRGAALSDTYIPAGDRPYLCAVCSKGFHLKGNLKTHMRIHTGERPYPCDLCPKRFIDSVAARRHKRQVHDGERPYVCEECGKAFGQAITKTLHYKSVHLGIPYPNYKKRSKVKEIQPENIHENSDLTPPSNTKVKAKTRVAKVIVIKGDTARSRTIAL